MVGQHMFEWTQRQLKEAREQLKLRFGALSAPVRQRVKAIQSAAELRALAGKTLTAGSLAEMGLTEPMERSNA